MKKMKRKIFVALAVSSYLMTNAQITINSSDVVDFGDRVLNAVDINSSVSIGNAGANQTWNFSNLNVDIVDTLDFTNPSWYGLDNPFNAQMVIISSRDDSSFTYITKTTSELKVDGIKQILPNGDTVNFPIGSTVIPFPTTYGMSGSSSANFEVLSMAIGVDPDGPGPHPTVDSLKITRDNYTTVSVDAWGNVTTPLGTFPALRENKIEYNIDTVWMYTNNSWSVISPTVSMVFQIDSITYDTIPSVRWWSNDPSARFPVVEFEYDLNSGMSTNDISWLKASPTTSVKENNIFSSMKLYPNPAKDEITMSLFLQQNTNNLSVLITDVTGKVVYSENIKNVSKGNFVKQINISELSNGTYYYSIKSNEAIFTKKITVLK